MLVVIFAVFEVATFEFAVVLEFVELCKSPVGAMGIA